MTEYENKNQGEKSKLPKLIYLYTFAHHIHEREQKKQCVIIKGIEKRDKNEESCTDCV